MADNNNHSAMQIDSDMPEATSSESDPPTPPVGRYADSRREAHPLRHHPRSDPYSLRDHIKPRRRTVSCLKPPLDITKLSAGGEIRHAEVETQSPPIGLSWREESSTKEFLPKIDSFSPLGADVTQRLKGTVDKLRVFSLAERIPVRRDSQGSQRKQVLPVIGQLKQDSQSFTATESYGEGEMHAKMRLSKCCNDLCIPPIQTTWPNSTDEKVTDSSLDLTPPELPDFLPLRAPEESISPASDTLRAGSVDEFEYPAMSPVGYFTTPASPHSPAARPRSGSQSPYRRTYSNSRGVHLKQSVLGKRKAESDHDDEKESEKRFCSNLSVTAGSPEMDIQTGDL